MSSPLAMPAVQVSVVQALQADPQLVALLAPAPATVGGGPGIYGGRAPQGAAKPYLVVEVGDEVPLNTFGPPSALKYGSNAGIVCRAVTSSYRDAPALEIQANVKRVLDEQPMAVPPYQSVCTEFEQLQPPIVSTVSGVELREHLSLYRVYVHQGAR